MLAGYEQPVTKKVSLVADWFSGSHDLAALVMGVQVQATHQLIVITGFKVPNEPTKSDNAALVEVTYEF